MSKRKEFSLIDALNYNFNLMGNVNAAHSMPQHQNPAFCRPALRPGKTDPSTGWIGGYPYLPLSVKWPHKNGVPYEFLCQINLSALPKNVWGGIGPRKGWLSFFILTEERRFDIMAVYSKTLGEARQEVHGWRKASSAYSYIKEEYDPFINPPVSWPLVRLYESDPETAIPTGTRKQYINDSEFSIDDFRLQPLDWQQLELLIESARLGSEIWLKFYQKKIDINVMKRQPHVNEQVVTSDKLIRNLTYLEEKYKAISSSQPFTIDTWLNDHDVMSHLLEFYSGGGYRLITYGNGKLDKATDELFGSESETTRAIKMFLEEKRLILEDFSKKFTSPSESLKKYPKPYGPLNDWIEFKAQNPVIWNDFYQKLMKLIQTQFEIGIQHFHILIQATQRPDVIEKLCMGNIPENWDMLLENIRSRKLDELKRQEQTKKDDPEGAKQIVTQLLQFETTLNKIRQQISIDSKTHPFNRSQWRGCMKPLLKTNLPGYLDREYPVVRSKLTAENCYHLLPTLEPELQDYFRQKWQHSAENATLQVGGLPRGWGHGFVENIKKSVMLIQIPTNTLIGLNYGDVSDLIIAIPKADLKRRKFSNVYVDISN